MNLYPEYSANIIVYLIVGDTGNWYVTEKETWFLNREKFASAFGVEPTQQDIDFSRSVASGDSALLLNEIEKFRVNATELKELISIYPPIEEGDDLLEMFPSLFVDFNQKKLLNLFPEPSGKFHDFPPEGWDASDDNFFNLIPESHKYWVIDNKNVFN